VLERWKLRNRELSFRLEFKLGLELRLSNEPTTLYSLVIACAADYLLVVGRCSNIITAVADCLLIVHPATGRRDTAGQQHYRFLVHSILAHVEPRHRHIALKESPQYCAHATDAKSVVGDVQRRDHVVGPKRGGKGSATERT
jgi:hypothetical protein